MFGCKQKEVRKVREPVHCRKLDPESILSGSGAQPFGIRFYSDSRSAQASKAAGNSSCHGKLLLKTGSRR